MVKKQKPAKSSKAKLKGDSSKLITRLNDLLREGKEMHIQPKIDGNRYEGWWNNVMGVLKLSLLVLIMNM